MVVVQLIVDVLMMMLEMIEMVLVDYWPVELVVLKHHLLVVQLWVLLCLKSPSTLFRVSKK